MTPATDRQFKVLVVEDQQRYRALLEQEIREMGYWVVGAESAEQAWQYLTGEQPSVIFLDLNLPGLSGMDLFRKINEQGLDVAVVILTAYGDKDSAVQALRYGADDFLSKPCSLSEIEAVLAKLHNSWIQKQKAQRSIDADDGTPVPTQEQSKIQPLAAVERQHILIALAENQGNKRRTAEQLGISLRTLYYKLESYQNGAS